MSDLASKLANLAKKKQLLEAKEEKLIHNRKQEIGSLAEKFDLLTVPANIVAGIFCDLKYALDKNLDKLKEWETLGTEYLQGKQEKIRAHHDTTGT